VVGTRLIARFGYENISDPGITDIQGPIWSGGFAWSSGRLSTLRVEYGHRYGKPTWNGDAIIALTTKLYAAGSYLRTLETLQARLRRSLSELTTQPDDLPFGIPTLPLPIQASLINATTNSDDFTLGMVWLIDAPAITTPLPDLAAGRYLTLSDIVSGALVRPGMSLTVTGGRSHSRVPASNTETESNDINVEFLRGATRRFGMRARLGVFHSQSILPAASETNTYRFQLGATYVLTRTSTAEAAYTWQSSVPGVGARTTENVLGIVLRQRL
jgi:hypothetical protein